MGITGEWDRRISRRTLLRTGGSVAAGLALSGGLGARAWGSSGEFARTPFALGVASGDPLPDGVVLWTRLAPEPLVDGGGMPARPYAVRYEVARDAGFRRLVRRGAVAARPDEAHSVHVELSGLAPGSEYFYRFKVGRDVSEPARTRTAPPSWAPVGRLRFAFASCQNFPAGYFNAYADVAAQDLDLVVHLGDYIYEGAAAAVRPHAPATETFTLSDYRIRHAQYKTDLDLQAAHAAHPWLVTWDDHEVDNNYADEEADPDMPREQWLARRAAAYQAYWEHMPLRRGSRPAGPDLQLYRRFGWGDLATFNVLDTRQYRSDQPAACTPEEADPSGFCPGALDPARSMLGAEQRDWLFGDLARSRARWNVLAQQTALAPYDRDPSPERRSFGAGDNWDGYVAERQALLDWIVARRTRNPVVITGDSHQNWLRNVPPNSLEFDRPAVATEFMGTSITSGGDPSPPTTDFGLPDNPHILLRNNNRGYVLCELDRRRWTSHYRIVPTVLQRGVPTSTLAAFTVEDGRPGAVRV